MAVLKVLLTLTLLASSASWWKVKGKDVQSIASSDDHEVKVRDKRAVDPLSLAGLVVSVAAGLQGAFCTFVPVCSTDQITPRLKKIEAKLEAIHDDVRSIKSDVQDLWMESKQKWYFNNIEYVDNQRKHVIQDIKGKHTSRRAKERQERFISLVLGTDRDQYVSKALFHIHNLIVKKRLVKRYLQMQKNNGKSPTEAVRLTWIFIKKLFRYQQDGYVSVMLAAALKYKNDIASFNLTMREVCTWWPKERDPVYTNVCAKLKKRQGFKERRKMQQELIFDMRELELVPAKLVQTDCSSKFSDSYTLLYSSGHLYVAQPRARKILIVKPETLEVVKSIDVLGAECGGSCHPFGISIYAPLKLFAIAAKSSLSGGESKIMLYKIQGDLKEPSGIRLQRYYTISQPLSPRPPSDKADVIGVAFCGKSLAYADKNGSITSYKMPYNRLVYGWNNGKPNPIMYNKRVIGSLRYERSRYKDHQYYFGCSNDGKYFVIERTNDGDQEEGVGAVPADTNRWPNKILDIADIKVMIKDWPVNSNSRLRMYKLKGIAMDSKHNLFYSSEAGRIYYSAVAGVYQRRYDGKRRYIREWDRRARVEMFGMAADDNGFLYSVQKIGSGGKCLYRFDHEIDFEDITIS